MVCDFIIAKQLCIVYQCFITAIDEQNCLNPCSDDEEQLKRLRCSDDIDTVIIGDENESFPLQNALTGLELPNTLNGNTNMSANPFQMSKSDDDTSTTISFVVDPSDVNTAVSDQSYEKRVFSFDEDETKVNVPVLNLENFPIIPVIQIEESSPVLAGKNVALLQSDLTVSPKTNELPKIEIVCDDDSSMDQSELAVAPNTTSDVFHKSNGCPGNENSSLIVKTFNGNGGRRPLTLLPLPIPSPLQLHIDNGEGRSYCRSAPLSPVIEAHSPLKTC